jgi:hypothetical protein
MKKILSKSALAILLLLAISTPCVADEESPADIAKQLHNPLSNLRELIFQLDVLPDVGPDNKTDWAQTFQPVYPVALPQRLEIGDVLNNSCNFAAWYDS